MSSDDALTTPPDSGVDGMPSDAFRDALAAALAPAFALGGELLGGGMSRVFVAEERALGRTVVVKVLPPDWVTGMNRDRFTREIQLAARLQHPHIVPLLAAGEAAGSLYYTMPYIEGESLRAALASGRRFSVRDVARILHDVVEALAYAHARGVIHRDVKPGNVLMLGHHALVTDFGVAKALSAARQTSGGGMFAPGTTSTGLAIGTPSYMAPEQLAADPAADHRLDLYAAGLLAYELLVGDSPFRADSPQATLAAQLTRTPTPLDQLRPDVPPALAEIVARCLAKEPAQRPETADALLAELEPITYFTSTTGGAPGDATGAAGGAGFSTPTGTTPVTAPPVTAPPVTAPPVTAPMTATMTAPMPAAAEPTVGLRAASAPPRRRPTGMLGVALLGMAIVLVGGWAMMRGLGARTASVAPVPAAPPAVASAPAAVAAPVPGPPVAAPTRLTRDDSLAIAAAVERRLVAEERARRGVTARPLAAVEAESLRAEAWQLYADSVRESVSHLARGLGNVVGRMPEMRRMGVPDSATIAALAAAGVAAGVKSFRFDVPSRPGTHPDARVEVRTGEFRDGGDPRAGGDPRGGDPQGGDPRRDPRIEAAIARIGERLPPPKPGVRRVLVLDLADGTGRPELRGVASGMTESIRRGIAARAGYELADPAVVRDLVRPGMEATLAAVTHSGAVISGAVVAQRDSQVSAIVIVHDAQRGYPRTVRTPRVAPDQALKALSQAADAEVFGALDRIRWVVPMPPPPATPSLPRP